MSYNFHPPLSSAPAVLYTVALGIELFARVAKSERLRFAGTVVFVAGTAVLPLTYLSGLWNSELLAEAVRSKAADGISQHEALGRLCLFLSVFPILFRLMEAFANKANLRSLFGWSYFLSLFAVSVLLAVTSFLGGSLVFDAGVGVRLPLVGTEPSATLTPAP